MSSRIRDCAWPSLAAPFDSALREAVRFVFAEVDPAGIIATGTIIRGEHHASSDLDIHVIHEGAFRRRVQRLFNDVPAEIFINPPQAIREYFAEEHADGRPLTAHMLSTGAVVYSAAPVVEELRREAHEWLQRPSMLSERDAVRARYGIASWLEDGADVVETDGRTATMFLYQAVTLMLQHFCRTRNGRVPRSKELLATVEGHDAAVAALAKAFFDAETPIERLRAAESLADRTIGARGFFPWDSGVEPFPPRLP